MKEKLLELIQTKFPRKSFGEILNYLQDAAEFALDKKDFEAFLEIQMKDHDKCKYEDGILLNGQYFDWKEYEQKKSEIVSAFLDYFNEKNLEKMYNFLYDLTYNKK